MQIRRACGDAGGPRAGVRRRRRGRAAAAVEFDLEIVAAAVVLAGRNVRGELVALAFGRGSRVGGHARTAARAPVWSRRVGRRSLVDGARSVPLRIRDVEK